MNSGCVGAVCVLHAQQVDAASDRFPPCMKHLHQVLRQKHRLRHQDRVSSAAVPGVTTQTQTSTSRQGK